MRKSVVAVWSVFLLGIPPGAGAAVPYAALGDSYSSGVGAGAYLGGPDCRRSANAYPARVASRLGAKLMFAACSGARVSDVVGQLGRVGAETRYVTVSAGGNDAGFADVLLECAKPWPWNCSGPISRAQAYIRSELPARLDQLYARIRARAPAARVVVVGYPRLFKPGDSCWSGARISKAEVGDLNRTADLLRDVTRSRALARGFRFADPIPSFGGHAVCDDRPWLNGVSSPLRDSFHPSAAGQAQYARLVEAALR